MNDSENTVIIRWSNLSLTHGRGRELIYRVLAISDSFIHVVELGTVRREKTGALEAKIFTANPPPKTGNRRLMWPREFVNASFNEGRMRHVAEHGIPAQMADTSSTAAESPRLTIRKQVVTHIETHGGDAVFEDRKIYARSIQNAAAFYNVCEKAARKWFEMFVFYGRHENALIDQDWRKGAPGVGRRNLRDKNGKPATLGRRTDSEKLFGKEGHPRRRLTKQLLAEYSNFIRKEAYDNNVAFPEVFSRWQESRFAFNRDKDGNIAVYKLDRKNYPTDDHMKRVGRVLLKKYRELRDRDERLRPGSKGGSAQDIVHDQLPVMDMDGTPADNYVLYGKDVKGRKPTVVLAVDRASCAIVGWDVSFVPENGDAYLNCYFSACTDKTRELHRWGVPHLRGMVFGCASRIFIDRGPGIGKKAQSAIVERCRNATMIAEPGSGQAKGHGEGVMGSIQKALAYLPGSTFPTGDIEEDRKRRQLAKTGAVTHKRFMQELLIAISTRNETLDVKHLLTQDMLKQKIPACPAEIYRYYKSRRRGDAAWDWPPEDTIRKLCVKRTKKAPEGIVTIDQREYTSSELQRLARQHAKMNNGASVEITTYGVPRAKNVLFWELPGNELGVLRQTEFTQKYYDDINDSSEDDNKIRNHLLARAKSNSRKPIRLTDGSSGGASTTLVSKAKQAKINDVERNAAPTSPRTTSEEFSGIGRRQFVDDIEAAPMLSEIVKAQEEPVEPLQHDDVGIDNGLSWIDDDQDLLID
ncbi:hypothetical protein ACN9MY_01830 [Pseudoduganella sp. R-31]|uniref:hypothetical protein n=1 Tax=Pseudoduganella sp. R-31 TaxID=3404060 RepID=UPI003CEF220E